MKRSIVFKLTRAAAALAGLFAACLFFSCEPRGYDLIMAAPEPLTELSVISTKMSDSDYEIIVQFRVPSYAILTLDEVMSPQAVFYLRKEGSPSADDVYLGRTPGADFASQVGELGPEYPFYILQTEIENGATYTLLGYSVDLEGQRSTPAETVPFVISW